MRRFVRHGMAGFAAAAVVAGVLGLGAPTSSAQPTPTPSSPAPSSPTPTAPLKREVIRGPHADVRDVAWRKQALADTQDALAAANTELRLVKSAAQKANELNLAEEERQQQAGQPPAEPSSSPSQGSNDSSDPRDIARRLLTSRGYPDSTYACFDNIIMRESLWDIDATNPTSGAYGIPQALPASKMASAGPDWRTNPVTQITWAIDYMQKRYGGPCEAWDFKRARGWY